MTRQQLYRGLQSIGRHEPIHRIRIRKHDCVIDYGTTNNKQLLITFANDAERKHEPTNNTNTTTN